jgi:uncharacterized protein with von Willebrand factor type A (vWA) domain
MRVTSTAWPPQDDASLGGVVPLGEFLWSLRQRGMAVSLRHYRSVERLLLRWPSTDVRLLRDAVASLIARDEQEIAEVRAAFDEWFDETPALPPPPPPKTRRVPGSRLVLAVLVLILITISSVAGVKAWQWMHPPAQPPIHQKPSAPDAATHPPAPPALPPEPRGDSTHVAAMAAALAALVILAGAVARRTRRRRVEWKRTYLNESLGEAAGPTRYEPAVKRAEPLIDRTWIEDVATIIGRGVDRDESSDHLDVEQSLRLTLRAGMRPQLAFEPPPRNAAVLILHDISSEMRPWREKVDAFVAELIRQRVAIERWFFDSDPSTVWSESFGQRVTLERLSGQRGHLSLLVISSGAAGRLADEHASMAVLRRWNYRAWLNPVANVEYWPPALWHLPIRVWPLTRNGLRGMAWDLAHTSLSVPNELVDAPRPVSADDVERMKRLIALVPSPTLALADELRRRYAPDVPEEVVLFLAAEGAFRGERYSLPKEDVVRLLAAGRIDAPSREKRVRNYLLDVLRDSEPEAGSVAHLRWQLDVAMQQMHVNEMNGDDHAQPVAVLGTLAEGPLREEVEAAAGILGSAHPVARTLRRALRAAALRLPDVVPESVRTLPPRLAWPGFAALPIAAVIAACTFAGLRPVGRGTGEALHHETRYQLTKAGKGAYSLSSIAKAPEIAAIYADSRLLQRVSVPGTLHVDADGVYLQARATLSTGQLALSNLVWVPKPVPQTTQEPKVHIWELKPPEPTPLPRPVIPPMEQNPTPRFGTLHIDVEPPMTFADLDVRNSSRQKIAWNGGDVSLAPGTYSVSNADFGVASGQAIVIAGQKTSIAVKPARGVVSLSVTGRAEASMRLKSQQPGVELMPRGAGRYDLFAPSGKYEIELRVPGSDRVTEWVSVTTGARRQEVIAPDIVFESGSAALDQQTLTSTTKKTYKVEERTEFEIMRSDGSVVAFRKLPGRDVWRQSVANQKLDLDYGGADRVNKVEGMILKDAQDLFIPNRVTPAGSGVDDKSAYVKVGGTWQPYGTVRDYAAAK